MSEEEWGPWIEHDGTHKPEKGSVVEREYANGLVFVAMVDDSFVSSSQLGIPFYAGECFHNSWLWADGIPGNCVPVIRYRIRKPRGLTILEGLLTDLPEKVDA